MAVTFRANGHKAENTASSVAVLPAGLVAGDFMLMSASVTGSSANVNTPSGWTQLPSSPTALGGFGTAERLAVFYRVAGASESAPTVTFSTSCPHQIDILAFTGCDGAAPVNTDAKGT